MNDDRNDRDEKDKNRIVHPPFGDEDDEGGEGGDGGTGSFAPTAIEWYYLLQCFSALLTVWNARNLNIPGIPQPIDLKDMNSCYRAWNRDCCIVAAPKKLIDPGRTGWHVLQAAQTIVRHAVTTSGWNRIELTGLDTMVRAGAVEAMLLKASVLRCTMDTQIQRALDLRRSGPAAAAGQVPVPVVH